jgi:hypothetical protein
MKNFAEQWLAGRASPPGMLACGVRRPDGKLVCRDLDEICPPGTMEKILGQFDGLRVALFSGWLAPRWCTWVFEQGHVRYVARPDGWLLGLIARSESDAVPKLDPLSAEFISLKLDG